MGKSRNGVEIGKFIVKLVLIISIWSIYHEEFGAFISNISEISVFGINISAVDVGQAEDKKVSLTDRFVVLQTHVNRRKLEVRKMHFGQDDSKDEYIELKALDDIDLRYGLLADAKRYAGGKKTRMLVLDCFDEDLNLKKGEKVTIYTFAHESDREDIRVSGNAKAIAVEMKAEKTKFVKGGFKQKGSGVYGFLTNGIWKSSSYKTDKVMIADGDGKVLLDFTYTLLAK